MNLNKVTPDHIETLKENEIFVFGSNVQGDHQGGAARFAVDHFGAINGLGVGPQGQSYAIPTMGGSVSSIKPFVDNFTNYAKLNGNLKFYVTKIGCGIAGYEVEDIAPLFKEAYKLHNVTLPREFIEVLEK